MVVNEGYGSVDPCEDVRMANAAEMEAKPDLIDLTLSTDDVRLQDEHEAPALSQQLPLNPKVFKTTDRILGDVINAMAMFDAGHSKGILKSPTISYASDLSRYLELHGYRSEYKFGVINNKIEFAPSQEVLENGVCIVRGFLYKGKQISNPFNTRTDPVFNVKIVIKQPQDKRVLHPTKHGFYLLDDAEISVENRAALVTDYAQIVAEAQKTHSPQQLQAISLAVPSILDSATFISLATKLLMRIELSLGFFDHEALHNFAEPQIQKRLENYTATRAETVPNQEVNVNVNSVNVNPVNPVSLIPESPPTPSATACFQSITRILKGPLTYVPGTDIKTIRSDHKVLNVDAGIAFMERYLSFTHNRDLGELFPPDLGLPLVRESYIVKYLESLFFSRAPLITLGDESLVSHLLNERVEFAASHPTLEECQLDSREAYILLSSRFRYSDNEIKDLYNILVSIDPHNGLKYFDFLTELSIQRKTVNLKTHVAKLRSEGKFGYKELCECYQVLEIPPENYDSVEEKQLLQHYIGLLIVTESVQMKENLRQALLMVAKMRRSNLLISFLNAEPIQQLSKAFEILDVNENVENELIITANEIKKSDYLQEANLYDRALLTIALHRKSFLLLEYIDKRLPYLNKCLDLDFSKLFHAIGADPLANDFQIITIFQERLAKDPSTDIRVLRQYLRFIGKQRKSKLISEFLKKGIIEPQFLPVENSPVGLNNIGNTCYLNSLLQYYFVITPLRDLVLKFDEVIDEAHFNSEPIYAKRRIGNRTVGFKETERSYQFMYQLRDLFELLIKSESRCVTPKKELAYLAFSPSTDEVEFQLETQMLLVHLPQLESPITVDSGDSSVSNSVITFDSEFGQLLKDADDEMDSNQSPLKRRLSSESCETNNGNAKSANTGHIEDVENVEVEADEDANVAVDRRQTTSAATCQISADQMENALEMGRQQDVTECIQNVLFQLESASLPYHLEEDDEQFDLIKELFYGKTKQILQPFDALAGSPVPSGAIRTKEERFLSLLVNIGDHPKDIYDALDTYFTEDVINMDDGVVKRSLTITALPKIMQIQIQRVQFDRERLMPVKSIEPIPFEENLYMDRYMDTEDEEIVRRRKQVFEWKRQISILNMKKHEMSQKVDESAYNFKDGLTVFKNYLESDVLKDFEELNIESETVSTLNSLIKDINMREDEINRELVDLQLKITDQFKDFTKIGYSLFAIFIHRGEASYGHYWIYIKDPKRNVYRKYNDEIVTEVSLEEVFNFEEGNTATPYFLVYVKDDLEKDFVDPLRREIEKEE